MACFMCGGAMESKCTSCRYEIDLWSSYSANNRCMMHYYVKHKANNDFVYFFDCPKIAVAKGYTHVCTKEMLEAMWPKTLNEKIDMIMLNLGLEIKKIGDLYQPDSTSGTPNELVKLPQKDELVFLCENFAPRTTRDASPNIKMILATITILEEYGYIKSRNNCSFTFTAKGWQHLGDLQKKNKELPQAFIAMWFDPSMATTKEAIKRAIEDSGYVPVIIDDKEHNKQIVPEIFYEIQNSKFVVADLCGQRNGVYYEAGYAEALGKEVILTCSKDCFEEDRRFDVAQKSTIKYKDNEDLYQRLLRRIEITVGKRGGAS